MLPDAVLDAEEPVRRSSSTASCSTKSGLPSAASTIRASASAAMPAPPSRLSMTCALASAESGASARRSSCSHSGRFSSTSGRATQRRSAGASSAVDATWSTRSSSAGSAQWTSSKTSTSGRRRDERLDELARRPEHLGKRVLPLREADGRGEPLEDVLVPLAEERGELRARGREVVAVLDARRLPQRLDERPEGDPVAVGKAPPADDERSLGGGRADVLDETRLADARIAGDQHDARRRGRRSRGRALPRSALSRASRPTSGDRSSSAARRSCTSRRRNAGTRSAFPFSSSGSTASTSTCSRTSRYVSSPRSTSQAPRGLLEPRRRVDRIAGHETLPGGRVAGDDLPRVDADAVLERDAVRALEPFVQPRERLLHLTRRAHGSQRVVLVDAREPEDGHHGVADELLDRAAVPRDRRAHRVEVAGHRLPQRLGVELLAEARRSLQVAEEDRDELAHLLRGHGGRERRSAEAAETELRGVFLPAIWAKLHAKSV